MSVTEYERNQLFRWFEEHMGKEQATTMMSLLPPVGWTDLATKRDLDALAERLDTKIDHLAERMDARFEKVDARFEALIERFDAKFDAVDARFEAVDARFDTMATKAELYELRSDLQRTFVTWMFASQAAVIAAMGVFLAVFR